MKHETIIYFITSNSRKNCNFPFHLYSHIFWNTFVVFDWFFFPYNSIVGPTIIWKFRIMEIISIENLFSLRIFSVDHYIATPIAGLDACYSEYRGSAIKQVRPIIKKTKKFIQSEKPLVKSNFRNYTVFCFLLESCLIRIRL